MKVSASYTQYTIQWSWVDYAMGIILILLIPLIKWIPLMMSVTGLFWIYEYWKRYKEVGNARYKWGWIQILMILSFVMLLVGMFWTENVPKGWSNVEHKLSLLLVPLIIGLNNRKMTLEQASNIFVMGLVMAAFLLFGIASYRSLFDSSEAWISYWRESTFSVFMHRSYLACYMAMGALIALISFFRSSQWFWACVFLLLSGVVLLTVSKAGIIALLLGVIGLCAYFLFWKKSGSKLRLTMVIGILFLCAMLLLNERIQVRFNSAWKSFTSASVVNNPSKDGTQARMMMWSAASKVFSENALYGVGTGDVDDALQMENKQRGNEGVVQQKLNAHNQFLNVAVQHGLIGLLILTALMILIFFNFIKDKNAVGIVVTITFFINLLFESFLETRSGVVPFCLLILLFSTLKSSNKTVQRI